MKAGYILQIPHKILQQEQNVPGHRLNGDGFSVILPLDVFVVLRPCGPGEHSSQIMVIFYVELYSTKVKLP